YAAIDHQMELDRLVERSVFDWPELAVGPPAPTLEHRRAAEEVPAPAQGPGERRLEGGSAGVRASGDGQRGGAGLRCEAM
ncbi:MAG: hypothetical protein IPF99_36380, partial [Deltaproteobacteria bacterium]|nr:hypothetical protein [Deltaproteobacteria bacterium]